MRFQTRSGRGAKIDHAAGVKMPNGVGLGSTFAQVRRDQGPEMIHPAPNGLVGDHDAAFRQQVFDVTEAQCEPEIEPDRLLDDFSVPKGNPWP